MKCSYDVLKARFLILKQMVPYKYSTQRNLMIVCFATKSNLKKWLRRTKWNTIGRSKHTIYDHEIANELVKNMSIWDFVFKTHV